MTTFTFILPSHLFSSWSLWSVLSCLFSLPDCLRLVADFMLNQRSSCLVRRWTEPQCCGSGMFIPDPNFLSILDPGSINSTKREVGKICFLSTIFCSHKYRKIVNNLFFNGYGNNMSISYQKYGFWIRDPRVKKAPDPGSATLLNRPSLVFKTDFVPVYSYATIEGCTVLLNWPHVI